MIRKIVPQGHEFPRGYGIAWYDLRRAYAVAYPIPLNILVSWALNTWCWMRWYGHRIGHTKYLAYDQGWERGYKAGLLDGEWKASVKESI